MAKRPSLHGAGRQALAAAGQKPAAPVQPPDEPDRADGVRERSVARKAIAPDHPAIESSPPAGRQEENSTPKRPQAPELKGAAALYCEMLGFGRERISQALDAGRMLSACRSPAEAWETQAQLARRATEQCMRESFRMMELTAKAIGESWASMQGFGLGGFARREAPPPK